jgi:hypothetical protein
MPGRCCVPDQLKGPLGLKVTVSPNRRSAVARVEAGLVLHVTLPLIAPDKEAIIANLYQRACKRHARHSQIWQRYGAQQPLLTMTHAVTLKQHVEAINAQTLRASLAGVQLGHALKTRMAQMNTRTRIMTVSRFVVQNIPELAFRYLIIHELCHLTHADHSHRFWQLVATHMPDFRIHAAVLDAHHYWLTVGIQPETNINLTPISS